MGSVRLSLDRARDDGVAEIARPHAPGSADVAARFLAEPFSPALGKPVVEYRPRQRDDVHMARIEVQ